MTELLLGRAFASRSPGRGAIVLSGVSFARSRRIRRAHGGAGATLVVASVPAFRASVAVTVVSTDGIRSPRLRAAAVHLRTLVSSALAMLLAVPLGIGRIYLAELAPSARPPDRVPHRAAGPPFERRVRAVGDLRAGARAADMGAAALGAGLGFLPPVQPAVRIGMLAAGIILAIMTVAFHRDRSREVLAAVPQQQREAALDPGADPRGDDADRRVALRPFGAHRRRAPGLWPPLGETDGGDDGDRQPSQIWPHSRSGYTMASVLANEFTEPPRTCTSRPSSRSALLLLVVTIVVNALAAASGGAWGGLSRRSANERLRPAAPSAWR